MPTPSDSDEVSRTCHYFVDEAGDGTLFNKKKKTIVGEEGCSNYFILGTLEVIHPDVLHSELDSLRQELLSDPTINTIPSMQPERKKTAIQFHAKDDCPEVRREVFKLLLKHDMRFFAVIRNKHVIVDKVKAHNAKHITYRYNPNQLYDRCISRLFRDRLHKEESYIIRFSKRGRKDRTESLEIALDQSKRNFRAKWNRDANKPIEINPSIPQEHGGLQAVDYFLWALQRLYERHEERYWNFVQSKVSLVHDVDDTRERDYGVYYSKENPLTLQEIKKKPGI
ncbi:MAG: DUF3800 domain-containing protein [Planctomycetaceae bacterium]|nr:DUF3800 domain-containing protein [Planctomycetaceae bacterium]